MSGCHIQHTHTVTGQSCWIEDHAQQMRTGLCDILDAVGRAVLCERCACLLRRTPDMQELLRLLHGGGHGRLRRLGQDSKARRELVMALLFSTKALNLCLAMLFRSARASTIGN